MAEDRKSKMLDKVQRTQKARKEAEKATEAQETQEPKKVQTLSTSAPSKPRKGKKKVPQTTIKIARKLAERYGDRAQQVRDNNETPVAASDRVYPAHLMEVGLQHILSLPIDWKAVKSIEDFQAELERFTPKKEGKA